MSKQLRIQITLSPEELTAVRLAYAAYVSAGGDGSLNAFVKNILMQKVRK